MYTLHAFSYYCGKQVVFFSHSRRLLKQSAFSVNLSISAATVLTAAWRAEGGGEVGKVQYKHTYAHNASVAWRAQWVATLVPVYVNESRIKRIQVRGEAERLCWDGNADEVDGGGAEVGWSAHRAA